MLRECICTLREILVRSCTSLRIRQPRLDTQGALVCGRDDPLRIGCGKSNVRRLTRFPELPEGGFFVSAPSHLFRMSASTAAVSSRGISRIAPPGIAKAASASVGECHPAP